MIVFNRIFNYVVSKLSSCFITWYVISASSKENQSPRNGNPNIYVKYPSIYVFRSYSVELPNSLTIIFGEPLVVDIIGEPIQ